MSQIRNVAKTDSRSQFHVPAAATTANTRSTTDSSSPDSTRQFGVSLHDLQMRERGELPLVIRKCTEYLEREGLEVVGIFRRAPNNVKVRTIKRKFDLGGSVWVMEVVSKEVAYPERSGWKEKLSIFQYWLCLGSFQRCYTYSHSSPVHQRTESLLSMSIIIILLNTVKTLNADT